ncbi:hypothetical protein QMK11_05705 [Campylobacter jejuni]|nr:hypothetical protein QMK11_05705 [Campylobacter jejuni]
MIEEILKDSDYKLDLFSKKAIAELEIKIIAKTNKSLQLKKRFLSVKIM